MAKLQVELTIDSETRVLNRLWQCQCLKFVVQVPGATGFKFHSVPVNFQDSQAVMMVIANPTCKHVQYQYSKQTRSVILVACQIVIPVLKLFLFSYQFDTVTCPNLSHIWGASHLAKLYSMLNQTLVII